MYWQGADNTHRQYGPLDEGPQHVAKGVPHACNARVGIACERRHISGRRFSPPKSYLLFRGEKRLPEIRLRSQARVGIVAGIMSWGQVNPLSSEVTICPLLNESSEQG